MSLADSSANRVAPAGVHGLYIVVAGTWSAAAFWLPVGWFGQWGYFETRRAVFTVCLLLTGLVANFDLLGGKSAIAARASGLARTFGICAVVICAVVILGTTSALRAPLASWALVEVAYYLLMAVAVLVLAQGWPRSALGQAPLIGLLFVASMLVYVVSSTMNVAASLISGLPLSFPEPMSGFANIRFFNQYQTWVLPFLTLALWLPSPTRLARTSFWRALLVASGGFFWLLLWHTEGRGTLYATAVALLVVALLCGRTGQRFALAHLAMAALGLVLAVAMFGIDGYGAGADHLFSANGSGRLAIWQRSWDLIQEHPWLGIGPMQFMLLKDMPVAHPHNAVIQWAVEWGIPAAALMTAGLTWLGARWLSFVSRRMQGADATTSSNLWLVALTTSMLGGAVHSLLSGIVVMPMSQMMLVIVLSLCLATWRTAHVGEAVPPERSMKRWQRWLIAVLILLAVAHVGMQTARTLPAKGQATPTSELATDLPFAPRYWLQYRASPSTPDPTGR